MAIGGFILYLKRIDNKDDVGDLRGRPQRTRDRWPILRSARHPPTN